jgi:hypothetical protein
MENISQSFELIRNSMDGYLKKSLSEIGEKILIPTYDLLNMVILGSVGYIPDFIVAGKSSR